MFKGVSLQGTGASGTVRTFKALPPQRMTVGSVAVEGVPFVTFVEGQDAVESPDFDGLLPVGTFKRVLIAHADHFAVLDPW